MGKETKIGLAVVGVLLVVFGALLFRKLTMSEFAASMSEPVAAAAPAPAAMADKPQVVSQDQVVQTGGATSSAQPSWTRGTGERDADRGDAPRAVYMPDEAAPVGDAGDDRYADHPSHQPSSADKAPLEAKSNPFKRGGAVTADADAADQRAVEPVRGPKDALREPSAQRMPDERSARPRRNPVRQASAVEPIGDADDSRLPPLGSTDEATAQPAAADADPQTGEPRVAFDNDPAGSSLDTAPVADSSLDAPAAMSRNPPVDAPLARQAAVPAQWQSDGTANSPPAAVEPAPPANGRYTVQPNDNLWTISEKVYGTGRYFKALYEHNRAKLPRADKLTVGTVINVPSTSLLEQNYPSLCPKQRKSALVKPRTLQASTRPRASRENVYVVEEGDTLFDIARYELGKASRWNEIYELNRDALGEDFDYLQPGTELALPAKSPATDSFTRQGESKIQR